MILLCFNWLCKVIKNTIIIIILTHVRTGSDASYWTSVCVLWCYNYTVWVQNQLKRDFRRKLWIQGFLKFCSRPKPSDRQATQPKSAFVHLWYHHSIMTQCPAIKHYLEVIHSHFSGSSHQYVVFQKREGHLFSLDGRFKKKVKHIYTIKVALHIQWDQTDGWCCCPLFLNMPHCS